MKFTITADIEFEANSPDEALLKAGLFFISRMEKPLLLQLRNLGPGPIGLDITKMISHSVDAITKENSTGELFVVAGDVFESPEMVQ